MPDEQSIRLMLFDDHPVVREGLHAVLERQRDMEVVAEANDGCEATELYRAHQPDIVLMDLRMPKKSGLEALWAIREEFPQAKVIMLSNYDGEEDVYQAIQTGAFGYLLKDAPKEEICETIRAVFEGRKSISRVAAQRLSERLSKPPLTRRETEVLQRIVAGYSNAEIGAKLFISEGTVKSHVNSILAKLNVTDRTQAATLAIRSGLVCLE